LLSFSLAFLPAAVAAQDTCLNRTVAVNVLAADGSLVRGLVADNFRAKLRGRPVAIESVGCNASSRRVVMLLDVSGSMVGVGYTLESLIIFSRDLLASAPPLLSFALLTFTDHVEDDVGFDPHRRAATGVLTKLEGTNWDQMKGKGHRHTAWLDTVMDALRLFSEPHRGDAIVVVTDGEDNKSRARPSDAMKVLLERGVRLFALVISQRRLPDSPLEGYGPDDLKGLAVVSGGSFMDLPFLTSRGSDHLNPLVPTVTDEQREGMLSYARQVGKEISEVSELNVKLPERLTKPHDWKLEVVDSDGKVNSHVEIVYPRKLAACN